MKKISSSNLKWWPTYGLNMLTSMGFSYSCFHNNFNWIEVRKTGFCAKNQLRLVRCTSLICYRYSWLKRAWRLAGFNTGIAGGSVTKVETLRPRQNGRHFPDNILKCIFLNENCCILMKISLKFVPQSPINNVPALVKIMAWRRSGDKPLSEPMMT